MLPNNMSACKLDEIEKEAEQGDVELQNRSGKLSYFGGQIGKDVKKAVKWLEKAAHQEAE